MLTPLWEVESPVVVSAATAVAGVEERMGRRGISDNLKGEHVSPGSLQVECLGLEAGEEEEDAGAELEECWDTCEEEELVEVDEEVRMESRSLDSSREDGMHSHVSRSENLE